ncbi:hypothetical protein J3A83DRAFT_4073088, partial [Scleroderma citrinum]
SDTTTGDNQKFDDEVLVLFLPLLDAFNSDDTQDWWYLTQHIQEWLLKIPCESQQWIWGHDLFWLVFMGAHPTFPLGKWPLWDKRIPLEGPYIEDLVQLSIAGVSWTSHNRTTLLKDIWLEFCSHIALF